MRDLAYGVMAGVAGGAICFGVGYLLVVVIGVPQAKYFGVGLEPWNLPGTILGAVTWGAFLWYGSKRRKSR